MRIAHLIPQAAAALGRYLRDYIHEEPWMTDEVQGWLTEEYIPSQWARLDWVAAQVALSIPRGSMDERYLTILQDWLANSSDPQKIAIAGQRLAHASNSACRDIIRGRADRVNSPLLLRLFALSLLEAGDDRKVVNRILARDPRNLLLQATLEDTGWTAKSVPVDFDDSGV